MKILKLLLAIAILAIGFATDSASGGAVYAIASNETNETYVSVPVNSEEWIEVNSSVKFTIDGKEIAWMGVHEIDENRTRIVGNFKEGYYHVLYYTKTGKLIGKFAGAAPDREIDHFTLRTNLPDTWLRVYIEGFEEGKLKIKSEVIREKTLGPVHIISTNVLKDYETGILRVCRSYPGILLTPESAMKLVFEGFSYVEPSGESVPKVLVYIHNESGVYFRSISTSGDELDSYVKVAYTGNSSEECVYMQVKLLREPEKEDYENIYEKRSINLKPGEEIEEKIDYRVLAEEVHITREGQSLRLVPVEFNYVSNGEELYPWFSFYVKKGREIRLYTLSTDSEASSIARVELGKGRIVIELVDGRAEVPDELWALLKLKYEAEEEQSTEQENEEELHWGKIEITSAPVQVKAGSEFEIKGRFRIWSRKGCPFCIRQIVAVPSWDPKSYVCVYNGIPGRYPGKEGEFRVTFKAPEKPGEYSIKFLSGVHWNCYTFLRAWLSGKVNSSVPKEEISIVVTGFNQSANETLNESVNEICRTAEFGELVKLRQGGCASIGEYTVRFKGIRMLRIQRCVRIDGKVRCITPPATAVFEIRYGGKEAITNVPVTEEGAERVIDGILLKVYKVSKDLAVISVFEREETEEQINENKTNESIEKPPVEEKKTLSAEEAFELVMKLENIKQKFEELAEKCRRIASYYERKGLEKRAERWKRAAVILEKAPESFDEVEEMIKESVESGAYTKAEIAKKIRDISREIVKKALFAVLGGA